MNNRYPGMSINSIHQAAHHDLQAQSARHQHNVFPADRSTSRRVHSPTSATRRLARSASPSSFRNNHRSASPANVALYLQRQSRPSLPILVKADAAGEGFSGAAIDLKRQDILKNNQKEAAARLHDPASVSKSDGGMGAGWEHPRPIVIDASADNRDNQSLPLNGSVTSANMSSLGDSHGTAIFRSARTHSPSTAVRSMVINPMTNKKSLQRNSNPVMAVRVLPLFATSKL